MSYCLKIIYKTKKNNRDISIKNKNNNHCENKIRIFGKEFIEKNKGKFKIIYKNKEYQLTDYFDDIDKSYKSSRLIKFKLKIIHNITNFKGMFEDCHKLLSILEIIKSKNIYSKNYRQSNLSLLKIGLNNKEGKINNGKNNYTKKELEKDQSLPSLLLSFPKILNVINMSFMFYGCNSLLYLPQFQNGILQML